MNIKKNITNITERIKNATKLYARPPDTVKLLAVSKTKPLTMIQDAYTAGQRDFGENYLQDALPKIETLSADPNYNDIIWHFIGSIQSNKTKTIAENFSWVHGVDRLKIARRLGEQRPAELGNINICIQVNSSKEKSKSGVTLQELPQLISEIRDLPGVSLRGLMTIPANSTLTTPESSSVIEKQRKPFRELHKALEQINNNSTHASGSTETDLDTLSMGMSGDLEAAIAEGATIVRVGTDIFGIRETNNR